EVDGLAVLLEDPVLHESVGWVEDVAEESSGGLVVARIVRRPSHLDEPICHLALGISQRRAEQRVTLMRCEPVPDRARSKVDQTGLLEPRKRAPGFGHP